MLIDALLNLLLLLLRALLLPLKLVQFPAQVGTVILTIIAAIADGAAIVNAYIDEVYIGVLFGFVVLVIALVNGYQLIRWVLKKIPFLGID